MMQPRRVMAGVATVAVLWSAAPHDPPPTAVSFRYQVLPLLQRQGCASAYCHGSATGRGGFKLSLFGSDPAEDYFAIAHDLGGRRLDRLQPDRSLLLAKPSLRIRHGGGRRLRRDGEAYAVLRAWIAQGAPAPSPTEPRPEAVRLVRDGGHVRVLARFSGAGGERDVTGLCVLSSSDDGVAGLDRDGKLELHDPGVAWLRARYASLDARLRLVVPYAAPRQLGAEHPIDDAWLRELGELGLEPGPAAATEVLARRLHLDLVGRPPTPEESAAFAAAPRAVAIASATDRLLRDDGFATLWGDHLARWMETAPDDDSAPPPQRERNHRMRRELIEVVRRGEPLHAFAERVLTENRLLVTRFVDPRDRAEFVGRAFLGIRLGCARCHDHPLDRWRRRQHLAFSALFADPRPAPGQPGDKVEGVLFDPQTGEAVPPALLPIDGASRQRRGGHAEQVAAFVLDPGHGMLDRNFANRVLGALLGWAPVEPTDDHRISNPPRHGGVLDAAARRLAASGGNLRDLVRFVVTSRLYALGSEPLPGSDEAALENRARREAHALPELVLRRAVAAVLGVAELAEPLPPSPLARQLALHNGAVLHESVRQSPLLAGIASLSPTPAARLEALYHLILSRPPRAAERRALAAGLVDGAAVRELAFALLCSREFGSSR